MESHTSVPKAFTSPAQLQLPSFDLSCEVFSQQLTFLANDFWPNFLRLRNGKRAMERLTYIFVLVVFVVF